MYSRTYGGLIWTNHAMKRLEERGLTQVDAWHAYNHPDSMRIDRQTKSIKYEKKLDRSTISIMIKENEKKELIVLSCWIDPPKPGSVAAKELQEWKNYKKVSAIGKILYLLKKQLGF